MQAKTLAERITMLQGIYDFFAKPIGWLLAQMCDIFGGNFALSIFIFTLIMNVIFMPLNIKQQKSMMRTQAVMPLISAVQKKYENDKVYILDSSSGSNGVHYNTYSVDSKMLKGYGRMRVKY